MLRFIISFLLFVGAIDKAPSEVNFEDQISGVYSSLAIQLPDVRLTFVGVGGDFSIEKVTLPGDQRAFRQSFGELSLTTDVDTPCEKYGYVKIQIDPPAHSIRLKMASNPGHEDEPPSIVCYTSYAEEHLAGQGGPAYTDNVTWPSNWPYSVGVGYGDNPINVCYFRDGRLDSISVIP